MKIYLFALFSALGFSTMAQVAITSASLSYYQDFDSLSDTTLTNPYSTLPVEWSATEHGSGADQTYRAAYGELAGGDLYSFGDTALSADRALGSIGSGSVSKIVFGLPFVNSTSDTMSAVAIQFMGEQWRQGRPGTARTSGPDTLFFEYAKNASNIDASTFTPYANLDLASPQNNAALNTAIDGNAAANRTWMSDTLIVTLAPNDTLWIRWRDFNSASYDDGLAIDSLTVTFIPQSVLPIPNFLYVGQSGAQHYEDFNTLSNDYSAGFADFNTLPTGWYAHEVGSNANTTYRVSIGEFGGGEIYSYGDTASTDRALGSVGSGSVSSIFYGAAYINNTGDSIRSMTVEYTGEQWRQGRPGVARTTGPDTLFFGFAVNVAGVHSPSFMEVDSLHFKSAENNGTLNSPLNGNAASNQERIAYTINNLYAGPNDTIWIRWRDFNSTSYDDGLAIDSLTVTFLNTRSNGNPSTPVVTGNYLSISQFNQIYTETFDSLGYDYSSSVYSFQTLPRGWYAHEIGSNADNTYKVAAGEFAGGTIYSFGDTASAERALGSVGSGSVSTSHYGSAWINMTGDTITTLEVRYIGEQWRQGRPGNARATGPDTLHFSFGINANGIDDASSFYSVSNLNFFSPQNNGVLNTPLNGNDATNQTDVQFVMVNLQILPGDTAWIRWSDFNSDSYDDGLAIDSVRITALQNFASTAISFEYSTQTIQEVDDIVAIPLSLVNGNGFSSQVEVYVADSGNIDFGKDLTYLNTNTIFQAGDTTQFFNLILNRNEPFEGTEYFVLGMRNYGNAAEGLIAFDTIHITNYEFPQTAISALKSNDSNGAATKLGDRVVVSGVVHGVNYSTSGGVDFYLIDNAFGINAYAANGAVAYQPTEGDEVQLWGQVAQFRGLTRIESIDSIAVLNTQSGLTSPLLVNTLDESTESAVVSLQSVVLYPSIAKFPSDKEVTAVTSTNDTITLFISSKTNLAGMAAPTTAFNIVGIGSQFTSYNAPFVGGYRLMAISRDYTNIGMGEVNSVEMTVYPVPFTNQLNIASASPITRVELISVNGQILVQREVSGTELSIDASAIPHGTYVLRVLHEGGVAIHKIVK